MPATRRRSRVITISMPPEMAAAAESLAKKENRTMSELMLNVIYPDSDAMFYIQRAAPKNDIEWNELAGKALALGVSARLKPDRLKSVCTKSFWSDGTGFECGLLSTGQAHWCVWGRV